MRAPHAVGLPHLTAQDELNAELMFSPRFQSGCSLAIRSELLLDVRAEERLYGVAVNRLSQVAAGVRADYFRIGQP